MRGFRSPIPAIALFLAFAIACISYPGLQQDEVLFARPFYRPGNTVFSISIGNTEIPLMLMTYLGALKTLLYMPLLHLFTPTTILLRLPCVLAGALALYLLHALLCSLHSRTAALIGVFLLATDSAFVLTSTFDWGPVALQHLLFIAALLCMCRFLIDRKTIFLALGFFLVGMAFWDKAVAVWVATGLAVGVLAVYPHRLKEHLSRRNLAIAVLSLCLGAAPLLAYNLARPFSTVAGNSAIETNGPAYKWLILIRTLNGTSLYGYLVNEEWQGAAHPPETSFERIVTKADEALGKPLYSGLPILLQLAAAALPFRICRPVRRLGVFLLVSLVSAWLFMSFTRNAGESVHHTVLLWPLPHMFAGIVLAQLLSAKSSFRIALSCLIVLSVTLSAANMNHYTARFVRRGAPRVWSEASSQLPKLLASEGAAAVGVDDWGIAGPLDVTSAGRLRVLDASEGGTEAQPLQDMLWIGWAQGLTVMPDTSRRLLSLAAANGLEKRRVHILQGRNSQPVLELYRFVPKSSEVDVVLDDTDTAIHYSGKWIPGGFAEAMRGSLNYSDESGAEAQVIFRGSSVVLVYTKAFNRGIALIHIDGKEVARLDLYDPAVKWQQRFRVDHLARGAHTLSVRVAGKSNPSASGRFVDIDAIIVESSRKISGTAEAVGRRPGPV